MIKNILLYLSLMFLPYISMGQINTDELIAKADSAYFDFKDYDKALKLYKEAKDEMDEKHKDFGYSVDKIARNLFNLELQSKSQFNTENSIKYSLEFIELVEKYPSFIDKGVVEKKYFMYKNLVVGYFDKEVIDKAKKYQELLYKAYKKEELPEGINHYYNFEFVKLDDKNIWGYEWFEKIPKDRFSASFSKIVYYIYSTNPDGTDKDELYRLHVLMFHTNDKSIKFDYVLTKRIETATEEVGGTLYSYTYSDPIDIMKLRQDIREVIIGNSEPDVKSYRKK